jgi:NAD(P)-dependent dehydrogenase (short-subunit alcohol dehydrogenase family)
MFQPDLLKEKVVLVTGGGTGLGRAMAERFVELGARLAICSRKLDVIQETAREIAQSRQGETFAVSCDVRDPEQVAAMADAVVERYGRIDVLVNNAAANFTSPTERLSHRAVDAILGPVLHGTFYCTLEVGKRWIAAAQPGVMLNIVATYVHSGSGFVVPSAVAKSGIAALTRSLAAEWGRYGIRQVAIAPGLFPTPGAMGQLAPTAEIQAMFQAEAVKRVPLGRVGDHSELADLASYLISDRAAYINGDIITIDGGEWLYGAGEFNGLSEVPAEHWDLLTEMRKSLKPRG